MPTVYIETTIPSYYFETRTSAEAVTWRRITRQWWDRHRHAYELVTSDVVLGELRRAPREKAVPGERMLAGLRLVERTPAVAKAARAYLEHRLVPRDAVADAFHLAFASVYGLDYLLTWNCRHLANFNKARHIAVLNARLGLAVPTMTTPLTLLPEGLAEVPDEE